MYIEAAHPGTKLVKVEYYYLYSGKIYSLRAEANLIFIHNIVVLYQLSLYCLLWVLYLLVGSYDTGISYRLSVPPSVTHDALCFRLPLQNIKYLPG